MTAPAAIGVSIGEAARTLALIEAIGEMQVPPLPPGKLQSILAKARKDLEEPRP